MVAHHCSCICSNRQSAVPILMSHWSRTYFETSPSQSRLIADQHSDSGGGLPPGGCKPSLEQTQPEIAGALRCLQLSMRWDATTWFTRTDPRPAVRPAEGAPLPTAGSGVPRVTTWLAMHAPDTHPGTASPHTSAHTCVHRHVHWYWYYFTSCNNWAITSFSIISLWQRIHT